MENQKLCYQSISSRFGPVLLLWHRVYGSAKVIRVVLPDEGRGSSWILREEFSAARDGSCPAVGRLARDLERFLDGKPVEFSLDLLDFEVCSSFQRRVLPAEFQVPRGRVTTYGRLARRVGVPGAARAVGNALSHNPFPLIIACHRCVLESGHLGGFRGGPVFKRELLEMEGIVFDRHSRVLRTYIG